MNRRDFLIHAGKTAGAAALSSFLPFLPGCAQPPTDERGILYWDRRKDIVETISKLDKGQQIMNNAILHSADKLSRAIQPDYLKFRDIEKTIAPLKDRKEKKTLGILDIYCVDSEGVKVLESYLTDFTINCLMANMKIGENFRVAERYKLQTILGEFDLRKMSDFDPRDAIKKGLFKGVDAILTGNLYPSRQAYGTDSQGNRVLSYSGGVEFLMRMIDVTDADIVGTATEHIEWSPSVEQWMDKETRRR